MSPGGEALVKVRGEEFRAWLRARGWDPDRLHPREAEFLRVSWEYGLANEPAPRGDPPREIRAEAAAGGLALVGTATLDVQAAEGGKPARRRFTIVACTGEPLRGQGDYGWDYPVIVSLVGIRAKAETPILDNHGPKWSSPAPVRWSVVGQSESAGVEKDGFVLRGLFFEQEQAAKDIIRLADQGFKWQASIGAYSTKREFVREGATVRVNGKEYAGPVYVSWETQVREVSFVVIGDDPGTSVVVASGTGSRTVAKKTFASYCKAHGYGDPDKMDAKMRAKMKARFEEDDEDDEEEGDKGKKDKEKAEAGARLDLQAGGGNPPPAPPVARPVTAGDVIAQYREEVAAEHGRVAGITAALAPYPGLTTEVGGQQVGLAEHAIRAGWKADGADFQLALIRAARTGTPSDGSGHAGGPVVPNTWYSPGQPQLSDAVLECALLQAGRGQSTFRLHEDDFYFEPGPAGDRARRIDAALQQRTQRDLRARYTEQVQEAAHRLYKGRIGLQQLLANAAWANGYRGREVIDDSNLEAVLRAAFRPDIRADGASTISAPNVFANVLNKYLLQGYLFAENVWRQVCSVIPTKDFKPTKSINIFGDFVFKKVDQNGQLQNAALTDEAFANQVDTFGRILNLNRQSIINDDLNALTGAPMLLGIGSADAVNITVWTLFLLMASNNAASNWTDGNPFWYNRTVAASQLGGGAINTNVISGGSSALSSASLQTAWQTYAKQVKPNGQPLGAELEILLVPPELWVTGWELTDPAAQGLVYGGGTAAKQPNVNLWRGRLKLLYSRYLSNPNFTGYSATAWYALANPMVVPVIQMAFLNGQEQPTVQTAQADFDTLGIRIRGFFDFGAAAQNPRGGVRSAGA